MVTGSQATSDANSVSSTLNNITSAISSLSGAWKGSSFENLNNKVTEFVGDFCDRIVEQLKNFAETCDLYKKYMEDKEKLKVLEENLKTLQQNYEEAVKADDSSKAASYSQQISETNKQIEETKQEMQKLKNQMEEFLSQITSVKLEAEVKTYSCGYNEKVDFTDDANFSYYSQNDSRWANKQYGRKGENTTDSPYGDSACGPTALAMCLDSFGQDVDPTDVAKWCTKKDLHHCGTDQSFVNLYTKSHDGVSSETVGKDREQWIDSLENGDLLVINAAGGTNLGYGGGHYLAVRGYDESTDQVLVADPYNDWGINKNGWYDIDDVIWQINGSGAWSVSKD